MSLDENTKEQARDDLRKLHGHAPYNTPSNICYGDGYFAASLVTKYGMSITELEKAVKEKPKAKEKSDPVVTVSKNFNDILAEGKTIFADGLIQGKPFAQIVTAILYLGERYGEAYARTEEFFFASTSLETYEEVQRFAVSYAFERLFKGNDMDDIVHSAALSGATWGFQQQKKHQNTRG